MCLSDLLTMNRIEDENDDGRLEITFFPLSHPMGEGWGEGDPYWFMGRDLFMQTRILGGACRIRLCGGPRKS